MPNIKDSLAAFYPISYKLIGLCTCIKNFKTFLFSFHISNQNFLYLRVLHKLLVFINPLVKFASRHQLVQESCVHRTLKTGYNFLSFLWLIVNPEYNGRWIRLVLFGWQLDQSYLENGVFCVLLNDLEISVRSKQNFLFFWIKTKLFDTSARQGLNLKECSNGMFLGKI